MAAFQIDIVPDPPSRHHHPANVATTETITVTWRARHTNGPWTAACDSRQAALDALTSDPPPTPQRETHGLRTT